MARLKITIEGEMSPEEVKRYIVAAWAGLPHEVAVSEVDLNESTGTVKVPTVTDWVPVEAAPAPAPVEAPPAPEPFGGKEVQEHAAKAEDSLVAALSTQKKLADALATIVEHTGAKELSDVLEVCKTLQSQVPILKRLGAGLEDRVSRAWAMML